MRISTFIVFLAALGLFYGTSACTRENAPPAEKPAEKKEASDTPEKNEALREAARKGDAAKILSLLKEGADVNSERYGFTALCEAAAQKQFGAVTILLEAGADVNKTCEDHSTPLMLAAYAGDEAIVQALLRAGSDVQMEDEMGHTALMLAACCSPRIVFLLL